MNIADYLTSNRLVYVLIGGIALIVFITIIVILSRLGGGTGDRQDVTLEFWGVFDDQAVFDDVIDAYERENPNVSIRYTVIPFADYESGVIDAFAAGQGPDIWMIHHTWLPKHIDKLAQAPERIAGEEEPFFTFAEFQNTFVEVAVNDLTNNQNIYAMPLYVDTLALFYNRDRFATAGIALPPETWTEFNEVVPKLVQRDENQNIVQAAIPLGTARNVNRSTDILMMLMLQNGTQMVSDRGSDATFARSVNGEPVGENALTYYTDFANPTKQVYTWNDAQNYSVDAFADGTAAMMINYSHQIPLIRSINPRLNFAIAPVPQHTRTTDARTYANYWAPAVSRSTESVTEAWRFVRYLASAPGVVPYLEQSLRPAARRDLIDQQRHDPELGVFAQQALTARSWFQADNGAIETIFADMIDNVILGRQTIRGALEEAQSMVSVLLGRL